MIDDETKRADGFFTGFHFPGTFCSQLSALSGIIPCVHVYGVLVQYGSMGLTPFASWISQSVKRKRQVSGRSEFGFPFSLEVLFFSLFYI